MEVLFKNSYIRNKDLAKEVYQFYYFRQKWVVLCYILILIPFFATIVSGLFGQAVNWAVVIFVPLYFLFRLFCYFLQVNTMIKRDNELYGKEISVETIVTNEYIQNTVSNGAINQLQYDKIKSVTQTKNLVLLRSKAKLIYIFRNDTFTKGNKDEFINFLRNKGVKIK